MPPPVKHTRNRTQTRTQTQTDTHTYIHNALHCVHGECTKKIKNKPAEENSGHVHALSLLSERLRAAQLEITHLTPMPEDVEVINAIKEQVQAFHVNS